jgi:hypothetical protein
MRLLLVFLVLAAAGTPQFIILDDNEVSMKNSWTTNLDRPADQVRWAAVGQDDMVWVEGNDTWWVLNPDDGSINMSGDGSAAPTPQGVWFIDNQTLRVRDHSGTETVLQNVTGEVWSDDKMRGVGLYNGTTLRLITRSGVQRTYRFQSSLDRSQWNWWNGRAHWVEGEKRLRELTDEGTRTVFGEIKMRHAVPFDEERALVDNSTHVKFMERPDTVLYAERHDFTGWATMDQTIYTISEDGIYRWDQLGQEKISNTTGDDIAVRHQLSSRSGQSVLMVIGAIGGVPNTLLLSTIGGLLIVAYYTLKRSDDMEFIE